MGAASLPLVPPVGGFRGFVKAGGSKEGWDDQPVTDSIKRPSKLPRAERESEQGMQSHKTKMSLARCLVVPALASAPIPLTDRSILQLNGALVFMTSPFSGDTETRNCELA